MPRRPGAPALAQPPWLCARRAHAGLQHCGPQFCLRSEEYEPAVILQILINWPMPMSPRSPLAPIACLLCALLLGLYILAYTSPTRLGPPVALAVRYSFFPSLVLGPVLGAWTRFMPWGTARRRLRTLAWIFFLAPLVSVIAYAEKSDALFLDYEAIVLVFPFLFAAICFTGSFRIATGRTISRARPPILAMGAVGLIVVGLVWSPPLLRDLFVPGTFIEARFPARCRPRNRGGPIARQSRRTRSKLTVLLDGKRAGWERRRSRKPSCGTTSRGMDSCNSKRATVFTGRPPPVPASCSALKSNIESSSYPGPAQLDGVIRAGTGRHPIRPPLVAVTSRSAPFCCGTTRKVSKRFPV